MSSSTVSPIFIIIMLSQLSPDDCEMNSPALVPPEIRAMNSVGCPCQRPRYTDPKAPWVTDRPVFPSRITATITVSSVLESDNDQLKVRASPVLQQLWPPLQPSSVHAFLRGKYGVSSIAQTS